MNFQSIYNWTLRNVVSIITGLLLLVVLGSMWYYISVEFQERKDTLERVETDRHRMKGEVSPDAAPLEPSVEGVLVTPPESFTPLIETVEPRQEWGDPIRDWESRSEDIPLQEARPMRGPS